MVRDFFLGFHALGGVVEIRENLFGKGERRGIGFWWQTECEQLDHALGLGFSED